MHAQETILRACGHIFDNNRDRQNYCEVSMGHGETLRICVDCWNRSVAARKAERKAQLAAMPRCEVPDCEARGAYTVAYTTLMCGRHMHRAEAELMRRCNGMFMGAVVPDKESLIELAIARRE